MVIQSLSTAGFIILFYKRPPHALLQATSSYSSFAFSLRQQTRRLRGSGDGLLDSRIRSGCRKACGFDRGAARHAHNGQGLHVSAFSQAFDTGVEKIQLVSADTPRGGLPRFYVRTLPALKGMMIRVEGDEFYHMTRVLRLNVNDRVELFDGRGGVVEGTLLRVATNAAEVVAVAERQIVPPTGPNWHVAAAFGTLKGGRGDWLVEKCTELGARSLIPLLTQRSAVVSGQRNDRWHRISMAATKQCQRLHTLDVQEPTQVQALLPEVARVEVTFLASAGATPLVEAMSRLPRRPEGGLLLIGPEGDFTEQEVKMLVDAGAVPVGLGQRRLRVETAAMALLTTVMLMSDSQQTNLYTL